MYLPASVNLPGASLPTRAPVAVVLTFMRTLLTTVEMMGNASHLQYIRLGKLCSLWGGTRVEEWIRQDLFTIIINSQYSQISLPITKGTRKQKETELNKTLTFIV